MLKEMLPKLLFSLLTCLVLLVGVSFAALHQASAEIATVQDWVGLYTADLADGDTTALMSPYRDKWVYTSTCTQTAGTTPLLAGSCTSNQIMAVNANTTASGSYLYRFFPNNSLYMTDKSDYFWVTFNISSAIAGCTIGESPTARVTVTWPPLVGVKQIDLVRNPGVGGETTLNVCSSVSSCNISYSYVDIGVDTNQSYTYQLRATSAAAIPADGYQASTNTPSVTTTSCSRPFIQTREGDVHSNEEINVPGGPTP